MKHFSALILALTLTACGSTTNPISPPQSVGQLLLNASPDDAGWGTFSLALQHEDLADVRELLKEEKEAHTVFSPGNTAFEAYFEARGITREEFLASDEVPEIVRAHIAPGNYYPKTFFENDGLTFDNLSGDPLVISGQGDDFYVNDVLIDGPVLEDQKKQEDGVLYSLLGVIEP
jgi:uncharacterized surface protein with fasciclin (FAS1) repeats